MNEQRLTLLIEKYLLGIATEAERGEVEAWYEAFDSLPEEFYKGARDGISASEQRSWQAIRQRLNTPPVPQPAARIRPFSWAKVAAGLALLFSIGSIGYYLLRPAFAVTMVSIQNGQGRVKQVTLPDSSIVWLNAGSEIKFRQNFSDTARELILSGEAYFEVRSESRRPFLVHSQGITTKVLGTSFNVNAYAGADTVTISLLTGKVSISAAQRVLGLLMPAQPMRYATNSGEAFTTPMTTDAPPAWTEGLLLFDNTTMLEIANTLERWYGYKIVFEHAALKACRYSATFENTVSLRELLDVLYQVSDIRYEIHDREKMVVFKGQRCNQ